MSKDPLVLVNLERWRDLEEVLEKDWPNSIQMEVLDTYRKWTSLQVEHNFKVYCVNGDITNGIVAVNEKVSLYEIIVLWPKEDTSDLEEALKTTKHINWDKEIYLSFATDNIIDCINQIVKDINVQVDVINYLELYVIERGSPKFNFELPSDLSFGPIRVEEAEFIDSVWPRRHTNSTAYFVDLIRANMGFGLYNDKDLIGWVFIRENGPIMHLYVKDAYRRMGYGSLILKYVTNVLLDRNKHCFAYCVVKNKDASAMYKKLNFMNKGPCQYCRLSRPRLT